MQLTEIQAIVLDKKLNNREISEATGYNESTVSRILNGKQPLSDKFVKKFALQFNDGELKSHVLIKQKSIKPQNIKHNSTYAPVTAKAGFSSGFNDFAYMDELEHFNVPYRRFDSVCFPVENDSMNDTLESGDILICDKQPVTDIALLKSGFIYVLDTKNGILVKRINKQPNSDMIWLESDNEDYELIEIPLTDVIKAHYVRRVEKWNLSKKMKYE